MNVKVYRISLVGHSRSGKSSTLKHMRFSQSVRGFKLSEMAQLFFKDRLPEVWQADSAIIRQDSILRAQLGMEKTVIEMAEQFDCDTFIILSDRGCFDTHVYIPEYAERLLQAAGSPPPIDLALILLPPEHLTDGGVDVRVDTDSAEDARLREAVINVWSSEKYARHHVFIPAAETIQDKAQAAVDAVNDYLGFTAVELADDGE